MSVTSEMTGGYPSSADIDDLLASWGIEKITFALPNYYDDYRKFVWAVLNAVNWTMALGIYCPSTTTVNVRGGKYLFKDTVKTYTPGDAINPTDNDTTYIWMDDANTVGSGIDGDGWPTTEHIKLAEIDVDEDGIITAVRDLRAETFLQYLKNYTDHAGASAEMIPVFWDKGSPEDDDEIRIPFYGKNDNDEKIEYARMTVKFTDVSDGAEAATISFSAMVAGALTNLGSMVFTTATQTLTNKTIDAASNTISNIAGTQLANISANGGIPFVLTATLTAGNTVVIHDANAPFKYRIFSAYGIGKSGDGGTWQIKNGANAITDAVSVGGDKAQSYPATIDYNYYEISANGTLSVVGDGSLADVDVYILCVRVA